MDTSSSKCSSCGFHNRINSKFCEQCGQTLERVVTPTTPEEKIDTPATISMSATSTICPNCKSENPAGENFCEECGTSLTSITKDSWFEQALAEIEGKQFVKSIWARALVEANGDLPKTQASYIKLRVEQLDLEVKAKAPS